MTPDIITEKFLSFMDLQGIHKDKITPATALDLMGDFYNKVKFNDLSDNPDSDMLLFQYGVFNWGKGENFELNITRQLIEDPGDDENMFQLALTLYFPPTSYKNIPEFKKWSMEAASLTKFIQEIKTTAGYKQACADKPISIVISTENV